MLDPGVAGSVERPTKRVKYWHRIKGWVAHNILGVNDTPHRLAFGVFLGFVVAWTPTLGLQMLLYVAAATLLRANKVVGVGIVWLTNPVTAVPVYYTNWQVGHLFLNGAGGAEGGREQIALLVSQNQGLSSMLTAGFWSDVGATLAAVGAELWLGSLLVGVCLGAVGYALVYRAASRRSGRADSSATSPSSDSLTRAGAATAAVERVPAG